MSNGEQNNRVVSGLFWKFGERFLGQGVSFCVSLVLARLLSPEDYGIISIVMIFMALADVFVISGFSAALIQKKDATSEDFSTLFYCSFLCSLVIYVILFAIAPLIADFYRQPILMQVVRVFALRIPLSSYYAIQQAYVSRHMLFRCFFWSTLIATIFSGIVGIVMAYMGFGVWALIAQYFASTIGGSIVLSITVPWHLELTLSWHSAKTLVGYGWKILLAEFSGTFFDHLRGLIIGRVYTSTDLAYYDKGKQLSDLITNNVSATVMAVLFPAIANLGEELQQVKQMTKRALRMMAFVIFPLMTGLAVVARPLVFVLYTEKWEACIPFMQLMCAHAAIGLLGTTALQAIKAIGRGDVLLKIEFWKKPVYLALLILSVQISVYATAVTMVLYSLYGTFVNMIQLQKYVRYRITEQLGDILPAILLSSIMGFFVGWITQLGLSEAVTLVVQVVTGIIVYVALLWILRIDSFMYLIDIISEKLRRCKSDSSKSD